MEGCTLRGTIVVRDDSGVDDLSKSAVKKAHNRGGTALNWVVPLFFCPHNRKEHIMKQLNMTVKVKGSVTQAQYDYLAAMLIKQVAQYLNSIPRRDGIVLTHKMKELEVLDVH